MFNGKTKLKLNNGIQIVICLVEMEMTHGFTVICKKTLVRCVTN